MLLHFLGFFAWQLSLSPFSLGGIAVRNFFLFFFIFLYIFVSDVSPVTVLFIYSRTKFDWLTVSDPLSYFEVCFFTSMLRRPYHLFKV